MSARKKKPKAPAVVPAPVVPAEPPSTSWVSRARARGTSKLDDACVDRICDRIARGEFKKHACQAEGVSDETLRVLERDDATIAAAVAEAHAAGVDTLRARLNECGEETDDKGRTIRYGDSRRELWLLERYDREAFAPPTQKVDAKNELTGKDGSPLIAPPTPISMADRRARALADLAAIEETTRDLEELEKGKTQ